jgi:hypothetical protein
MSLTLYHSSPKPFAQNAMFMRPQEAFCIFRKIPTVRVSLALQIEKGQNQRRIDHIIKLSKSIESLETRITFVSL